MVRSFESVDSRMVIAMGRLSAVFAAVLALWAGLAGPAGASAAALEGPRFMSLKTDQANARRGPSARQPVSWVYQRRGLPVEVLGSSGDYRRIRDPDGDVSWMHVSQLSARPSVFVRADADGRGAVLLKAPRATRKPVAELGPGVVAWIERCEGDWLRVSARGASGWIEAERLFGAQGCAGA